MVLRLGNANHIEVLALRIVQLRIAKVRVGFEPRTRFEKAANVWVFEDAAVLAEDDAANQFQIVDFQLMSAADMLWPAKSNDSQFLMAAYSSWA